MKPLSHLDPDLDAAQWAALPLPFRAYLLLITHARPALLVFAAGLAVGAIVGLAWAGVIQ